MSALSVQELEQLNRTIELLVELDGHYTRVASSRAIVECIIALTRLVERNAEGILEGPQG